MTSILKVDSIQNAAGNVSIPVMAGAIIQVQHEQLLTGTFSQSITALTDSVVNNFPTVTITPTSTSSKIKIDCQWSGEFGADTSESNHIFFFYRDAVKLGNTSSNTNSYNGICQAGLTRRTDTGNNGSTGNMLSMTFFDEPNTTSAVTYKLGVIMSATQILYINRNVSSPNSSNYENGTSFISATEIAG